MAVPLFGLALAIKQRVGFEGHCAQGVHTNPNKPKQDPKGRPCQGSNGPYLTLFAFFCDVGRRSLLQHTGAERLGLLAPLNQRMCASWGRFSGSTNIPQKSNLTMQWEGQQSDAAKHRLEAKQR